MTKVKMTWDYEDSVISQEIRLYNDDRRIDFVTHADWHEHQQLLRECFSA
ncbi:MAG: glycoside hydrolase family 38 C-terminal domain-containing protein [Blautia sp.]